MINDILELNDNDQCLKEAIFPRCSDVLARRIDKNHVKDQDFKTEWEKDKRPGVNGVEKNECELKAISVNLIKENFDQVVNKYKRMRSFSPNHKNFICLFQIDKEDALIVNAPEIEDVSHYNLYKCQSFDINKIKVIDIIDIK
mgnify:CR=1 FL=1